jgi:hypothetical protein
MAVNLKECLFRYKHVISSKIGINDRPPHSKSRFTLSGNGRGDVTYWLTLNYIKDTSRISLGSEYFCIRPSILRVKEALVSLSLERHAHINLEVMFVRKSIAYIVDIFEFAKDDPTHLVHCSLNTCAIVRCERRECRI